LKNVVQYKKIMYTVYNRPVVQPRVTHTVDRSLGQLSGTRIDRASHMCAHTHTHIDTIMCTSQYTHTNTHTHCLRACDLCIR
jgi:hypothetical protein